MKFVLIERYRNIPERELIADMKRVAKMLGAKKLSVAAYDEHGRYSASTIWERFHGWNLAVKKAGLVPVRVAKATVQELFDNLEAVWRKKGAQPAAADMKHPYSKISITPYQTTFGSWSKALAAFVEYINNGRAGEDLTVPKKRTHAYSVRRKARSRKSVPKRLRYMVLERDNYKCRLCGRSPASENGVKLHIDHIIPWSKGGETLPENLQTLCGECNIGKGNLQ